MTPQLGTVGVVATRGFAPGCIRLATRSHYNHVVISDGVGGCWEAKSSGVRHTRNTVPYDDVVWLTGQPLTEGQRANIAAYLQDAAFEGIPYNWPAIWAFGFRTFLPWLPHKWLDKWADRRKNQICSELALNAQRYSHVEAFPDRLAATVSPADWLNLALKEGWT